MEIFKAQFYHSVKIEGKERQTVQAGVDGLSKETKLTFKDNLILVDSPKEPNLIVVGLTNTRSFHVIRNKQNEFVFSRENSIPFDVTTEKHEEEKPAKTTKKQTKKD